MVNGGSVSKVEALTAGRVWSITIQTDSSDDVTVSLYLAASCQELAAICSGDGKSLYYYPTLTVPGPGNTTIAGRSDASLASLAVDGAVMAAAFDPGETLYTAEAASGVSQVTMHAEASASAAGAAVSVAPGDADMSVAGHQVALAAGAETAISVAVTAPDGATVQRYWLVVSEASAAGGVSSALNGMQLTGLGSLAFDDQQIRYELSAPEGVSQTTVVASRADSSAAVEVIAVRADSKGLVVDRADPDPAAAGHQVQLSDTGDTLVIARVTSSDGLSQRLYLTLITRTPSVSYTAQVRDTRTGIRDTAPALSELSITSARLIPMFGLTTYDYTATVAHDVSEVTVSATDNDQEVTGVPEVTVIPADSDTNKPGHQVALGAPGSQTAITVVASANSQLTSYTVSVSRARPGVSEPHQEDFPPDPSTPGRVPVGGSVTGYMEEHPDTPWLGDCLPGSAPSPSVTVLVCGFHRQTDNDWYAVTLEGGKTYQVDLQGASTGNGTLAFPFIYGIYTATARTSPAPLTTAAALAKTPA